MNSKKINLFAAVVIFLTAFSFSHSQTYFRNKINIPDITGYKTLKCDFHMHTVFSDGDVWPTFRVNEAWRDGLDAIAITDHIEYRYRKNELPKDENKSYQLAT